jgi:hypothetical protein
LVPGCSQPKGSTCEATATGPPYITIAGGVGGVALSAYGVEFVARVATGDREHTVSGGLGLVTAAIGRGSSHIIRGAGASGRERLIAEAVAGFSTNYGGVVAKRKTLERDS